MWVPQPRLSTGLAAQLFKFQSAEPLTAPLNFVRLSLNVKKLDFKRWCKPKSLSGSGCAAVARSTTVPRVPVLSDGSYRMGV